LQRAVGKDYFPLKKPVSSALEKGRPQRLFFYFFKKPCAESPGQRPSAKTVFYFLKKLSLLSAPCNYAWQSWEHPSWKNFSQSCRA
jgi:hypothetical protein